MMTPKMQVVLLAIHRYVYERGMAPSYGELAAELHLSSLATIHKHVYNLVRDGYLQPMKFKHVRAMEITDKGKEMIRRVSGMRNAKEYHAALQRIGSSLNLAAGTSLTEGAPEAVIKVMREAFIEIAEGLTTDQTSKHIARKALGLE